MFICVYLWLILLLGFLRHVPGASAGVEHDQRLPAQYFYLPHTQPEPVDHVCAIARHLLEKNRGYALFSTHYFELTRLAEDYAECANVHLDAVEHGHSIVFLHAVEEGPASQSYGIQVAALAGIPGSVIRSGMI